VDIFIGDRLPAGGGRPSPGALDDMPHSTPTEEISTSTSMESQVRRRLAPGDLAEWLDARVDSLAERWSVAIREQGPGPSGPMDEALDVFTYHLVGFLPWMLGPYRDLVEPLWLRGSELFGSVAARRGLAAGEVIEEFQLLRELVIRDLYRDPPLGGRLPLSLREILRLNRGIDRGVTYASVGHTDALFFQFFEGEGISRATGDELAEEVRAQLRTMAEELEEVVGHARAAELVG
jgi:hypothetical protein